MITPLVVSDCYSAEQVAGFYRSGAWTDQTLADIIDEQAESLGAQTFATDATTKLSFAQLREESTRLAVGLKRSGVGAGDRVVVQLPNWTEFVVIVAAISRCGAIVVPVMPIYRDDEVAYVLADSQAKAAFTGHEFAGFDYVAMYDGLRGGVPELANVYVVRADESRLPSNFGLSSALYAEGDLSDLDDELGSSASPDDGHLIVYTSGTTSRPKGCFHTWNTLAFTFRTMARSLGWTQTDVAFGPSPITHATGYMTSVLIPLVVGARTHLMEAWEPVAALDRIREHGCTTTVTATVFLKMLLAEFDPSVHDASSMRLWVAAGSPIPPSVIEDAARVLPDLEVLSLYGRSENMVSTLCSSGDDPIRSLSSDGCPPEGVSIQIVNEKGDTLETGAEGDICYLGPGHMLGYHGQPEITSEMFTALGYSRSGDLGVLDSDGYLRVTGRTKDIIIRGGMNISAREIEELLGTHPMVREVAVVATPDERLGEKVCACVVAAAGEQPTLEDLVEYLRVTHRLAIQKLPQRLALVDSLPMTATGKVQKHLLRDLVG